MSVLFLGTTHLVLCSTQVVLKNTKQGVKINTILSAADQFLGHFFILSHAHESLRNGVSADID